MRSACTCLRQLGRCASTTAAPLLGRPGPGLPGRIYYYYSQRPFTSSSSSSSHDHSRAPPAPATWKLAAPTPPSSPHPDETHDALPLPEQLRVVMRLLPHSVVVCTALSTVSTPDARPGDVHDDHDDNGQKTQKTPPTIPRGMTMSSFTSLSLRPTPVVTFNVATPSRTLDALAGARAFNIHVLRGDAEGARVADWFRRGNADGLGVFDPGRMWAGCGCRSSSSSRRTSSSVDDHHHHQEEEGEGAAAEAEAPLLRGKGVLYAMKCRVLDDAPAGGLVPVRDHVVVLAEVVEIVEGAGGPAEVFGLVYADRRYRAVGNTMVVADHQEED